MQDSVAGVRGGGAGQAAVSPADLAAPSWSFATGSIRSMAETSMVRGMGALDHFCPQLWLILPADHIVAGSSAVEPAFHK